MYPIMMKLGSYQFSLNHAAYSQLRRSIPYRWVSQLRIQNYPVMQYMGKEKEEITLEGILYPHYKGGVEQLTHIQQEAEQSKPLMLVDANGKIWGYYVISTIEHTDSIFTKEGLPKKITFSLTLLRYGEILT